MRRLHPGARGLLEEWRALLARPVEALIPVLLTPAPWSRELRHVTPFTGLLTASERAAVYRAFAESELVARDTCGDMRTHITAHASTSI
ncbi:MAG: hypothetical protein MUF00_01325 [Gemmatimonadaceae bacterium]|jgi:hypothetical protein|nr:hypothetical protein [Gemmatimonadaceae bacterium]